MEVDIGDKTRLARECPGMAWGTGVEGALCTARVPALDVHRNSTSTTNTHVAAQHSTAAVHTPRQPHNRASTGDSTCTKRHKHVKQTQTRWANQRRKHPTKTRAERSSGAHQGSHTQPSKHGRGHTAWAHSVDTQRGHTAWTHSVDTQRGHTANTHKHTATREPAYSHPHGTHLLHQQQQSGLAMVGLGAGWGFLGPPHPPCCPH